MPLTLGPPYRDAGCMADDEPLDALVCRIVFFGKLNEELALHTRLTMTSIGAQAKSRTVTTQRSWSLKKWKRSISARIIQK